MTDWWEELGGRAAGRRARAFSWTARPEGFAAGKGAGPTEPVMCDGGAGVGASSQASVQGRVDGTQLQLRGTGREPGDLGCLGHSSQADVQFGLKGSRGGGWPGSTWHSSWLSSWLQIFRAGLG